MTKNEIQQILNDIDDDYYAEDLLKNGTIRKALQEYCDKLKECEHKAKLQGEICPQGYKFGRNGLICEEECTIANECKRVTEVNESLCKTS